ncbi:MAG: hypothetical protein QME58_09760 [Bacteroidota bacterium]|nr:hypothetical protein [Bacteroidota bacterium]
MWNTIIITTVGLITGIILIIYVWVEVSSRNQEKNHKNRSGTK